MKWNRERQRSRSGYPDLRTMEEPKRSPENAMKRYSKHPEVGEGQDQSQQSVFIEAGLSTNSGYKGMEHYGQLYETRSHIHLLLAHNK